MSGVLWKFFSYTGFCFTVYTGLRITVKSHTPNILAFITYIVHKYCICQVIIWTPEGPLSYASESLIVIFLPWYNWCVYVLNGNKMFLNWNWKNWINELKWFLFDEHYRSYWDIIFWFMICSTVISGSWVCSIAFLNLDKACYFSHYGLLMPYGDIDPGQH